MNIYVAVVWLVLVAMMVIGWFMNIFAIVAEVGGGFTTLLAFRALGVVVAPLGSILGWFA